MAIHGGQRAASQLRRGRQALARRADLTAELAVLKARRLPVLVLWGDKDAIIPRASFDSLCAALGSPGEVVSGHHSWLLADPDAFGEAMVAPVSLERAARRRQGGVGG